MRPIFFSARVSIKIFLYKAKIAISWVLGVQKVPWGGGKLDFFRMFFPGASATKSYTTSGFFRQEFEAFELRAKNCPLPPGSLKD